MERGGKEGGGGGGSAPWMHAQDRLSALSLGNGLTLLHLPALFVSISTEPCSACGSYDVPSTCRSYTGCVGTSLSHP